MATRRHSGHACVDVMRSKLLAPAMSGRPIPAMPFARPATASPTNRTRSSVRPNRLLPPALSLHRMKPIRLDVVPTGLREFFPVHADDICGVVETGAVNERRAHAIHVDRHVKRFETPDLLREL